MIDIFTKQEKIFISFLLLAVVIGAGVKIFRSYFPAAPQIAQPGELKETEQQIQEKAGLIDSLAQASIAISLEADLDHHRIDSRTIDSASESIKNSLLVDINTASAAELVRLPQIGPVLADRIVKYRNAYGAFKNIEDLTEVKGIGKKKLNLIRPYIYINQKK